MINNVTLKSVVWSSMNETLIFMALKTICFQLWFLFKSDSRISPAGKYLRIIRTKTFDLKKRQYLPHY